MLKIQVTRRGSQVATGRDLLVLVHEDWNDWWKYQTLYGVIYFDSDGTRHDIGSTKIGQRDIDGEIKVSPSLPTGRIERLPEGTFSLGQSPQFYKNLMEQGADILDCAMGALRDIAYDATLRSSVLDLDVTQTSLMREVSKTELEGQFHRIAHGSAPETVFRFEFTPSGSNIVLDFKVSPRSWPPTNVHVIVGRNGVGKSRLLNDMALDLKARYEHSDQDARFGRFRSIEVDEEPDASFANIVTISFSAFESLEPVRTEPESKSRRRYIDYVGLRRLSQEGLKDTPALAGELTKTAIMFIREMPAKKIRWIRAIEHLENDPVFADAQISQMIREGTAESLSRELPVLFKDKLSSGHKIVLLSLTKLVEHVEERTLVLIDEPEAHLHPPLLSAYIRALSYLLTNRNGVAVAATHSPVVLQEVPRSCVWMLSRSGRSVWANRPELETFGENVGSLTNTVFGLEVTATGFHRMLTDAAQRNTTYESALAEFGSQIGFEGRAILRSQIFGQRDRQQ
ncbi:AAA family ATPase [Nocardia puris]|uniref:Putative AbiEii toxin of type IV toxin-antitoxin system n=1 Tax=Nocardia puris TaxID=208602 RepID=A0A366CTI5_9NOCA|nr:AAA family ATPase [Nocardia puris]RBO79614.1 putative AbiEii toxin of type IV toxin-antitoxin system [Nocardia puris]